MKLSDEVLEAMSKGALESPDFWFEPNVEHGRMQAAADVLLESLTVEQLRELAAKQGMVVEPKVPPEEMLQESIAAYRAMIKPLERGDE